MNINNTSSLNCCGKVLNLATPVVMGILNITPDSFCSVGRFLSVEQALQHARQMVVDGAAIIDVGGEPTNPGVHPIVSLQEELERVIPVVTALAQELPVPISVDTSKPEVIKAALAAGAGFINDVRALTQPGALAAVAESKAAVCLMHMAYPDGKADTQCDVTVEGVKNFLKQRLQACLAAGIPRSQIVLDPGIGGGNFGKNLQQNLQLLARLGELTDLGVPLLVGVSRKLFIGELLAQNIDQRLNGSLAAAVLAVHNGAAIIRAHDVRATVEALKVASAIRASVCI